MSWIKQQWEDYRYNVQFGATKGFYRMATVLVVLILVVLVGTGILSIVKGVNPFQIGNMFS